MAGPKRLLPGEDGDHATFCRICEAYCGMVAKVEARRIVKIGPDRANPHSGGHICIKGPSAKEVLYDPDRILRPLRRTGGPGEFEPVGWDEALDDIATRLAAITARHGAGAAAVYTGNPAAYASHLMLMPGIYREMGIGRAFSAGSQDANPRLVASWLLYGAAYRLPIPDLVGCDFLLVFGANPLVSHGSVLTAPRIREDLDHIAARGRVVVIDPRRTETARKFEHVSIRPDTDAWMLSAMLQVLFSEGLVDQPFLDAATTGASALAALVADISPERAAQVCGVPAGQIRDLARAFASAGRAAAYSRLGLCRGQFSTLGTVLVDALNVVTGKFGTAGGKLFAASPIDAGMPPAGFDPSLSPIGDLPTVGGRSPTILLPHEMLSDGEGRIRALGMVAGNVMLSAPGGESWAKAFEALELSFSIDLYMNETNRHADYILPAATFLEREDVPVLGWTYMARPYAQYTDAIVEPQGQARPEHVILRDLRDRVRRLQGENVAPAAAGLADLLDPLLGLGAPPGRFAGAPEGLTLARMKQEPHGLMLGEAADSGGWRSKIAHSEGRIALGGEIIAAEFARLLATAPDAPGDLRMIGRRELRSINSWMHNVDRLVRSQSPTLLIHPADARAHGVTDGAAVEVASANGRIIATAELSDEVREGVVSYPHGWGHDGSWALANGQSGQNVNLLVATDPGEVEQISGASYLDGFRVTLRCIGEGARRPSEALAAKPAN